MEIACSLPVAERGWLPSDRCVGLSGQRVGPKLYIALGISRMPQHLAGIRRAQTVVAVNTDARAAIFNAASHGIVGDLHEVVPHLTRAVSEQAPG
ncbi:MAG: FAD-binding protein [Bifidobacteriaceae bacterium]|nr:FAD-binding protein [Bifidobacteriaceae bacterium]